MNIFPDKSFEVPIHTPLWALPKSVEFNDISEDHPPFGCALPYAASIYIWGILNECPVKQSMERNVIVKKLTSSGSKTVHRTDYYGD